jgi:hypothetical protein
MNTTNIILIIILIIVICILYNDYKYSQDNFNTQIKPNYIRISPIIEKLDNLPNYLLTFKLDETISYIPDDCLPLMFEYDIINNTLLLKGSGQIIFQDTSLDLINNDTPCKLNLILSNKETHDIYNTDIEFNLSECRSNPSVTINNSLNNPITLKDKYNNVSGSITIGTLIFNFNEILLGSITGSISGSIPGSTTGSTPSNTICSIKICEPLIEDTTGLAPIIQPNLNAIDTLIQENKKFALYTYITKDGVPSSLFTDKTKYKVYLSGVLSSDNRYGSCNITNGIFKFTDNLTQGSIFNANSSFRDIPILDIPYKYLDFYNVILKDNKKTCQTKFYNLSLNHNNYSLSYCLQECDPDNNSGLCAQEKLLNGRTLSEFMELNNNSDVPDKYGLKNFMKFKFESDGSVTPYFLSYSNNIEKIYFITNKYNTIDNPFGYKSPIYIPTYPTDSTNSDKGPYFEIPDIIVQNSVKFLRTKKIPISGLNIPYTNVQINKYRESVSWEPEDTIAFENSAYTDYALKFFIEEIDPTIITKLPLNE